MQRTFLAFGVAAIVCGAQAPAAAQSQSVTAASPRQGPIAGPKAAARPPAPRRRAPARKAAAAAKLSPVQLRLRRDTRLAQAVLSRLPAGADLMAASAGFGDVGQFVAAVSASRTLEIPFGELRRRMVGDRMPLLLAIQDMRPRSNYRQAARRAEQEAAAMISAGSPPPPPLTLAKRKS
ncbi:MAG: hypothetical protein M3545_17865 [Acidobacteriota bacterium]|nr:hypothetical protein [Acidobacteriota bacterium]